MRLDSGHYSMVRPKSPVTFSQVLPSEDLCRELTPWVQTQPFCTVTAPSATVTHCHLFRKVVLRDKTAECITLQNIPLSHMLHVCPPFSSSLFRLHFDIFSYYCRIKYSFYVHNTSVVSPNVLRSQSGYCSAISGTHLSIFWVSTTPGWTQTHHPLSEIFSGRTPCITLGYFLLAETTRFAALCNYIHWKK